MSVTINTLGPNSRQIVVNNESTPDNIINAINTSLVALGWTLIDTVSSGTRNCIVKKVYSALNTDSGQSPTTKYMILRFDAPKGLWNVTAAEFWDPMSHTATNETFHNNYSFPMSLQYSNNVIYVFASPRFAAFATSVRSEVGPWQGVFEFEREAPEDIAALEVPCFGWTSALTIGQYYGNDYANLVTSPRPHTFWVPRTVNGYTGWGACRQFIMNTAFGTFPPPSNQCTYGSTTGFPYSLVGMLGAFGYNSAYAWDAGKKVVSSLKLAGASQAYNTGRIFGIKVTPNFGAILDTTTLPIDTNGFFNTAGTNSNHYVFPISGGCYQDMYIGSNRLTETTLNHTIGHAVYGAVVYKGRFVYTATSSGIWKLDQDTAAWTQIPGTSGTHTDLIYDGGSYLYSSTASGVTRLYLVDDTVSALSISGGSHSLAVDDTYLYSARATRTATPSLDIIDLATFTLARTYTSSYSFPYAVARFMGLEVDYKGGVLCRAAAGSWSSSATGTSKAYRIDGATAVAALSPDQTFNVAYVADLTAGPSLYDFTTDTYHSYVNYTGNIGECMYLTAFTSPAMNIAYHASTPSTESSLNSTTQGASRPVPFKGYYVSGRHNTPGLIGGYFSRLVDTSNNANYTVPRASTIGGVSINRLVNATDGVFLYSFQTLNNVSRIGGQSPGFSSAGSATARILFKA